MQMPTTRRQRRFFSFRIFVALGAFGLAITAGLMTAAGPDIVWGPQPQDNFPSLIAATDVDTGDPVDAVLQPGTLGPGVGFRVVLTIPAGLDGHVRVNRVELTTDHDLWSRKVVSQYNPHSWPDFMPNTVPAPAQVTLRNLGVPEIPGLINATVSVRLNIMGRRPALEGIYLVDESFSHEVDLTLKLGHGLIEPSGAFNFDPYNRWTTGMACLFFLAIVSWLLRPPRSLILEDPADLLPQRMKR